MTDHGSNHSIPLILLRTTAPDAHRKRLRLSDHDAAKRRGIGSKPSTVNPEPPLPFTSLHQDFNIPTMGRASCTNPISQPSGPPTRIERQSLRHYFLLAFSITWGVGALGLLLSSRYPVFALSRTNPLLHLATFGPTIAGLVVMARTQGPRAIVRLLARAIPRVSSLHLYAIVILEFLAAYLIVDWLIAPGVLRKLPTWSHLLHLLPLTLVTDSGPLGEEFGWRGFALPALLHFRSPLAAAILLGAIWAVWHLPAFFIPTLTQSKLSFAIFVFNSISLSVIMTWLYLRSNGDLFLMILIHLMANYCSAHLEASFVAMVLVQVLCAALILVAAGKRFLRSDQTHLACSTVASDPTGTD